MFKKIENEDKTKYDTFYSNSQAEILINESDIDDVFESNYTIISNIEKSLGKGSGWIIDSVSSHNISISKYNPLVSDFEKFKEEWPNKEKFYSSLTNRKISGKEYEHDLNVRNKFEKKTMKYYHNLHLKCDVLLLANV